MHAKKLLLAGVFLATMFASVGTVLAATVSVEGKAKSLNTANSYIDFTGYNSNVTIDNSTGIFSGYAFSEDLGWFAFGTTDNSDGPVSANLTTGVVTGKAKSLNTSALLDFTNFNSNVTVNISTGVFTGHVFSVDLGWFNFADTGVNTGGTTLDSVAPSGFALIDPADESYTKHERPSFRWRATSDAIGSISKYRLSVENGETGDFVVDNIPASRMDDFVTSTYVAHYEGFGDSDTSNDYITLSTKSSTDWGSEQNDGRLKEGKRTWTVQAHDSNGNITSATFTLFADFSGPSTGISSINSFSYDGQDVKTADTTPQFSGRVTDRLAGDTTANSVVSGPKLVEIKLEKKNSFGQYDLHSTATVNFSEINWESDGAKITDNTEQLSNKYALFSFTPEALEYGEYRASFAGTDIAGNGGGNMTFLITITRPGFRFPSTTAPTDEEAEIVTPIGEEAEEEQTATQEAEIVQEGGQEPVQAGFISFLEGLPGQISEFFSRQLALLRSGFGNFIAWVQGWKLPGVNLAWLGDWFGNTWSLIARAFGDAASQLQAFAQNILAGAVRLAAAIAEKGALVSKYIANVFHAGQQNIAAIFARQKELANGLGHWWQYTTAAFTEIVLDKEPTRITNVDIVEVGKDYAVITWQTNHYTKNNKINYGEDTSYGNHAFAPDFEKEHTVRIEGLEPGVKYAFEVMSQNKNYVYDAHYEFITIGP